METSKDDQQGLHSIVIKDKAILYAAYMSFVQGGGLFIPTKKIFEMGQKLSLVITLFEDSEKYSITGKVVWITPHGAQGNKKGGIGLQLDGTEGETLKVKIESLLAASLKSTRDTFTM